MDFCWIQHGLRWILVLRLLLGAQGFALQGADCALIHSRRMRSTPLLAQSTKANEVEVTDAAVLDGILFQRVLPVKQHDGPPSSGKPPLLYLPGMDGLGTSAGTQLPELAEHFDTFRMSLPAEDRSTFAELRAAACAFLARENAAAAAAAARQPTVILGESFGGLLALGVALERPADVRALFPVNPATSFDRTPWATLGQFLSAVPVAPYRVAALLAFVGTIPDLQQVASVPGILLNRNIPPSERPQALADRLVALWGQIGDVSNNLPPETLRWRLREWLTRGTAEVNPRLSQVTAPTVVLAGEADRLLPSKAEALRLRDVIKSCEAVLLPNRGHVPLFEDGGPFRVMGLITSHPAVAPSLGKSTLNGALQRSNAKLVAGEEPVKWKPASASNAGAAARVGTPEAQEATESAREQAAASVHLAHAKIAAINGAGKSAATTAAASVRVPQPKPDPSTSAARAAPTQQQQRTAFTKPSTQQKQRTPSTKPSLLSGAASAVDFAPPSLAQIEEARARLAWLRRGVSPVSFTTRADGSLARGFSALPDPKPAGRPRLFVGNHQSLALDTAVVVDEVYRGKKVLLRGLAHPAVLAGEVGALAGPIGRAVAAGMVQFGAVPVSPRNILRLLARGDSVLLFPGGLKEAYHLRGQEYEVQWPSRPEFVRMAASAGADIVPFSAVGAAECMQMLLDPEEALAAPLLGNALRRRSAGLPTVRRDEQLVAPLAVPKLPARFYFLFGRPIEVEPGLKSDREACEKLYLRVREEVRAGVRALLAAREKDPFGAAVGRLGYELAAGGQAPSLAPRVLQAALLEERQRAAAAAAAAVQ